MRKFTKILEDINNSSTYEISASVKLIVKADSQGEASYIAESILAGIENIGEYNISNVEETDIVLESIKSPDEVLAKSFVGWLRENKEYFINEKYDIDNIYKIFMSTK